MSKAAKEENLPTLPEVVEKLGWGWAQTRQLFIGGSVWAADGAELLLIGSVTRAVKEEWGLSATQRGMIVSVVFVGVLIGNLLSGNFGDTWGRRMPIFVSYVGIFIFSIASAFSWGFSSMIFLRCLVGISFGLGQPAWNTMGTEIAPSNRRLHMNAYSQCLFSIGEIYSGVLIYMDDPRLRHLDWRWLIIMGAVPSIIMVFLSACFFVESPMYLAVNGQKEKAKEVLERMRQQNGLPDTVSVDFKPPQAASPTESATLTKLKVVLGRDMVFTTAVVGFSCFTLNFLYYGGLYAFPQVLPEIDTGLTPAMSLIVAAFFEMPGYIVGLLVGVNVTRKLGIQVYLVLVFLSTLVFCVAAGQALAYNGRIPFTLEVFLQIGILGNKLFAAVGFLIVYVFASEIYKTTARTTGTAICLALGRFGSMMTPLVYEWLTESTGTPLTFMWAMAACCIVNLILVSFLKMETSGKLLRDDSYDATETSALKP